MISHFLNLEWKQFFRSSYWEKGIAIKIVMALFFLYLIGSFLLLGVGVFYILKKEYPDADPLKIVNSLLIFVIIGDLIFRYLMQKLPVMNIKPLLTLPIKKSTIVHFLLGKSMFSGFNFLGLFFYIPFAIVLLKEGYEITGILAWLFTMLILIQVANFLNFIINKNTIALVVLIGLFSGIIAAQYFDIYNILKLSQAIFDQIVNTPLLVFIPLGLLFVVYYLNYKLLRNQVYLDEAIKVKEKEANAADLSWANRFGEMAPFIKNEIRLIWRNKRTKTVFLMSFLFVAYGLIFFTNPIYKEKMEWILLFAATFVTGGFATNYGQFIPAWDSAYYKMLMTQNLSYRKYLESKWYLMVVMTAILFILATPYIYFGIEIYLMIAAGAIFNIGFNTLFLLYAGSFNRKRIDLNANGFGNTQGISATQFLIIIPLMGLPIALFYIFSIPFGFNAGIAAVALTGILALVYKNRCMEFITKKYKENKYATIHAFKQK